jgi:hypothetical protein
MLLNSAASEIGMIRFRSIMLSFAGSVC